MEEFKFRIAEAFTPGTLPLERLAAYAAALAKLLGERPYVHLDRVVEGSAVLVAKVDVSARPVVFQRVRSVAEHTAAPDIQRAFRELDDLLAADNATGELIVDSATVIIFPGKNRPQPVRYGPFKQEGRLEGQIVRIGGTDESIHIQLRDGPVVYSAIETNSEIAKQLGRHLFDPIVRLHGTGTWFRDGTGAWELKKFKVTSFEVLDDAHLVDVVERLRAVRGNEWAEVDDPVGRLLSERHGDEEAH